MANKTEDDGIRYEELAGVEVSEVLLNGAVRINFGKGRRYELTIEKDFTVCTSQSDAPTKVEFRPYVVGWEPTGMNELVSLFHAVVAEANATPDATLRISFANGAALEVLPDPRYEGWHIWIDGEISGQLAGSGLM
ncbi:MAG TPA: DUF6188 family protein [Acidimicrobiales bacterium]|nr:DUF6188 family protein [Acidimicrobiales bacterium]